MNLLTKHVAKHGPFIRFDVICFCGKRSIITSFMHQENLEVVQWKGKAKAGKLHVEQSGISNDLQHRELRNLERCQIEGCDLIAKTNNKKIFKTCYWCLY